MTGAPERCIECGKQVDLPPQAECWVGQGGTPPQVILTREPASPGCVFCAQRAAWGYVDARKGMPDKE